MKEKLIIKNFGPIKDVELDLGRFNILIGEQATGKSTVAKVLAVCRYFSYIHEAYSDEITQHNDSPFFEGMEEWGLNEHLYYNTYISYECKHYIFRVECNVEKTPDYVITDNEGNGEVVERDAMMFTQTISPLTDSFKNLLTELEKIKHIEGFATKIPTSFFLNDVKNVIDNPYYLPTQRGLQSIFDIGQSSVRNLSSALFNQLSKMDGIARLYKQETYIEPLDIYYVNRNGHGFIRKANETRFYSLYNAASGYQSMIPVVLAIKHYTERKRKTKTLIIEEPELDVFPTAQDKLIQYLSEKNKESGSTVLFTTHSPYTLTSVNNMMFAYQVGQINPEKASAIIEKKYWIDYKEVSAYMMKADGTAENIMDEESMQIKGERIDEVSGKFNKDYDAMLDIKYAAVNEG